MKKYIAMLLVLTLALSLAACGSKTPAPTTVPATEAAPAPTTEAAPATEAAPEETTEAAPEAPAAMTYADFVAASVDDAVLVTGYVQSAAYNAAYGNVCLFLSSEDGEGAYYVYRAACDDALAEQLTLGAFVTVEGFKGEWSGEVEVVDATVTVDPSVDPVVVEAKDVTALLAADELALSINQLVAVKGAEVVAYNEDGDAFSYAWDGSGEAGANSDLYFKVSVEGVEYTFTVESDEHAEGTDVYTAVTELQVGDVIDLEGFLYWYEGAQLHVCAVSAQ